MWPWDYGRRVNEIVWAGRTTLKCRRSRVAVFTAPAWVWHAQPGVRWSGMSVGRREPYFQCPGAGGEMSAHGSGGKVGISGAEGRQDGPVL
jgi:hypothetical protein